MALNEIKPLTAASAVATLGSAVITVSGNVDCSKVYPGTVVFIADSNGVRLPAEAIKGTVPDAGESTITLRYPWSQSSITGALVAFNTNEGLADAVVRLREIFKNADTIFTSYEAVADSMAMLTPQVAQLTQDVTDLDGSIQQTMQLNQQYRTEAQQGATTATAQAVISTTKADEAASAKNDAVIAKQAAEAAAAVAVQYPEGQLAADLALKEAFFKSCTLILDFDQNDYRIYEKRFGLVRKELLDIATMVANSLRSYWDVHGNWVQALPNEPRINYCATGQPGYFSEVATTNLFNYPRMQSNGIWDKNGLDVLENSEVGTDGEQFADALIELTTTGSHRTQQIRSVISGTRYSVTVRFKFKGRRYQQLQMVNGFASGTYVVFDFQTLSVVAIGSANPIFEFESLANGFVELSMSAIANSSTAATFVLYVCNAINSTSYLGDGASGVIVDYFQAEAGYPTSLIENPISPSSQAIRAADALSVSGASFSQMWGKKHGCIYLKFVMPAVSLASQTIFTADNGSANERINLLKQNNNSFILRVVSGGGSVNNFTSSSSPVYSAGTIMNAVIVYSTTSIELWINGALVISGALIGVVTPTAARIGVAYDNLTGQPNTLFFKKRYSPRIPDASTIIAISRN